MASDAESGGIETQDVGLYILSDPVDAAVEYVPTLESGQVNLPARMEADIN
jgi:hypothetical protein